MNVKCHWCLKSLEVSWEWIVFMDVVVFCNKWCRIQYNNNGWRSVLFRPQKEENEE